MASARGLHPALSGVSHRSLSALSTGWCRAEDSPKISITRSCGPSVRGGASETGEVDRKMEDLQPWPEGDGKQTLPRPLRVARLGLESGDDDAHRLPGRDHDSTSVAAGLRISGVPEKSPEVCGLCPIPPTPSERQPGLSTARQESRPGRRQEVSPSPAARRQASGDSFLRYDQAACVSAVAADSSVADVDASQIEEV